MQKKPSEWISIADLMSGVMAVVVLLLVISVLQNTYAEIKHKQAMENSQQSDRQKVANLLADIQASVAAQGAGNLIDFNMEQSKITLKDNIFARGSACITPEAKTAFSNIEDKITSFLQQSSNAKIFVEGHTDNIPVSKPVTDYQRFCTVYDDNYTLSAARAREARKLLVGQLDTSIAKRIIVAGYGDSQPIKGISPEDDANRRVEVRLSLE